MDAQVGAVGPKKCQVKPSYEEDGSGLRQAEQADCCPDRGRRPTRAGDAG